MQVVPVGSEEAAHFLSRSVVPIGLALREDSKPWEKTRRATATLLRLKKRDIWVTCCHVWEGLQGLRRENSTARIVGYLIDTRSKVLCVLKGVELIDKERPSLDVATFRGIEDRVHLPGMRFINYERSYLPDPKIGEAVVIVGYPGVNVEVTEERCDFGYMHLVLRCSSVSERQIVCVDEQRTRIFCDHVGSNTTGIELGGLSGSAAYVLRDGYPRFVGIVTECSRSDVALEQTVCISRLGCILPDGTLDHTAIAW